jgi:hypothetical protein
MLEGNKKVPETLSTIAEESQDCHCSINRLLLRFMAGTTGLEPATSAVTGQRSNQLSYVPRCNRFAHWRLQERSSSHCRQPLDFIGLAAVGQTCVCVFFRRIAARRRFPYTDSSCNKWADSSVG